MKCVDIFIKTKWAGGLRGSGIAAAAIVYIDYNSIEHMKPVTVRLDAGTKDRLQLMAVTKALHTLRIPCSVGIYMDSPFLENALRNGWPGKWEQAGWKKANGKKVANDDIWNIVYPMIERNTIGVMKYIGRYDKELNEILKGVDEGATNDAEG